MYVSEILLLTRKKKLIVLLSIPDNMSTEEEVINIKNVSIKHYDKSKFENYVYREWSGGV